MIDNRTREHTQTRTHARTHMRAHTHTVANRSIVWIWIRVACPAISIFGVYVRVRACVRTCVRVSDLFFHSSLFGPLNTQREGVSLYCFVLYLQRNCSSVYNIQTCLLIPLLIHEDKVTATVCFAHYIYCDCSCHTCSCLWHLIWVWGNVNINMWQTEKSNRSETESGAGQSCTVQCSAVQCKVATIHSTKPWKTRKATNWHEANLGSSGSLDLNSGALTTELRSPYRKRIKKIPVRLSMRIKWRTTMVIIPHFSAF